MSKRDLERLQGTWHVASLEVDGQAMPDEMLAGARIVIEARRFRSIGMGAEYGGSMALDASQKPPHLDLSFDSGPEKGNTNRCIYEITGDNWRICIATRGNTRPASFVTAPGTGFALEVLSRNPPSVATHNPKLETRNSKPAAHPDLQGEWQMLSGAINGKAMPASEVKWVKRATRGNETTVLAGPQTMLKVEFTCHSTKSPRHIDYLNLAGSNKGKTQHGIYVREGDVLTVCMAAPGKPRPTGFTSEAGSGTNLTVWKKQ